jgi:hypothetical protein
MNKKIIYILFFSLGLAGCQSVTQPIRQTSDYLSGQVQIEQKKQADRTLAQVRCQELCQNQLSTDGQNFAIGPCLSNEIIPDWVCDVAHRPRLEVDNDSANQCFAFVSGQAHHFVEVDGNCGLIKAQ